MADHLHERGVKLGIVLLSERAGIIVAANDALLPRGQIAQAIQGRAEVSLHMDKRPVMEVEMHQPETLRVAQYQTGRPSTGSRRRDIRG
jgi:hypothetical protein